MNNRTTIKHVLNNCQISERLRGGLTMYSGFFKVEFLDEVECDRNKMPLLTVEDWYKQYKK